MRIGFPALLTALALQAGCSSLPELQRRSVTWIEGTWEVAGVETCSALPVNIHFAPASSKLFMTYPGNRTNADGESFKKNWVYRVLSATDDRIRVWLAGEDRVDASGLPVTWDIRKITNDEFCWRRSDWIQACTVSRTRCAP